MMDDRWNGVMNLVPPTDPFIPDKLRLPPGQPPKGEYQMFERIRIHNFNKGASNKIYIKDTEPGKPISGDIWLERLEDDTYALNIRAKTTYVTDTTITDPLLGDFWLKGTADNLSGLDTISNNTFIGVNEPTTASLGDIWLKTIKDNIYDLFVKTGDDEWTKGTPDSISDLDDVLTPNVFMGDEEPEHPQIGDVWIEEIETDDNDDKSLNTDVTNVEPGDPTPGDIWLDGSDLSGDTGDGSDDGGTSGIDAITKQIHITENIPGSPLLGDQWLKGVEGIISTLDVIGSNIFIGDSAPIDPLIGDMWLEGDNIPNEGDLDDNYIDIDFFKVDLTVPTFADLPRHLHDWPEGSIGKLVAVEVDETRNGHRTVYRIRTFVIAGFFVYNLPIIADMRWNIIDVDWMNTDWHPEYPNLKQQYPSAPWRTANSYRKIEEEITDKKHPIHHLPSKINHTSYIHNMTLEDISIFNWTTKQWENLYDSSRWKFEVRDNPANKDWGFKLTFVKQGLYDYDMRIYWNKLPDNQNRNATLKRNAIMDISTVIVDEINTPAINMSVNTGRTLKIRKLFPYEQKESFTIGYDEYKDLLGYEMNFKLSPYMHYKNQIHLADIKIFNKTANRFENILDSKLFEVRFKDPKTTNRGYETNTTIVRSIIGYAGEGFADGPVWGWNQEFGVHIFGNITATVVGTGYMLTFTPSHCPNPPTENVTLEFQVYQHIQQTDLHMAIVLVEFKTEHLEVHGDGYIHNVSNPMAPVPEEFKVLVKYELDGTYEYDIIISKSPQVWSFIENTWMLNPTFHISDYNIQHNRLYIMTDKGRFPLINPSTGRPSFYTRETETGTDVTFLSIYRRYENLEVRSLPYPMRSVYVQRRVPMNGYIDLKGKLNKPLNKKYFEFWMNGRLLHDEVTIISPSKLVLHGLKSLRNFEIIEINRDSNEYFSDTFLEATVNDRGRVVNTWDYNTYLDDVLEGKLEGDNYTLGEQEYLLSPIWRQVDECHPSFRDYPPNVDLEDDIIARINTPDDLPIDGLDGNGIYQFLLVDIPTIEGIPLDGRSMKWEQFGWRPIEDSTIVELLNEEWSEEIENNAYLFPHVVISEYEWYGKTSRLYDTYGIQVHNLNEAAYTISDINTLNIDTRKKRSRIIRNQVTYDLN